MNYQGVMGLQKKQRSFLMRACDFCTHGSTVGEKWDLFSQLLSACVCVRLRKKWFLKSQISHRVGSAQEERALRGRSGLTALRSVAGPLEERHFVCLEERPPLADLRSARLKDASLEEHVAYGDV